MADVTYKCPNCGSYIAFNPDLQRWKCDSCGSEYDEKTMHPYDAVLFDLDGTLLNTLEDLTDAVNHTLRVYGHPAREKDEVRRAVGNGVRKLIERVLPGGADDPDMSATSSSRAA